jgi:hypothetical protein
LPNTYFFLYVKQSRLYTQATKVHFKSQQKYHQVFPIIFQFYEAASIWRKSLGSFSIYRLHGFSINTIQTVKQWQNITPKIKSCMEKKKNTTFSFLMAIVFKNKTYF